MGYSAKQRDDIWRREAANAYLEGKGRLPICNLCDQPVMPGEAWDVSHDPRRARAFGGNKVGVGHRKHNREHGAQVVTPAVAKADRVHRLHVGAGGPGLGKRPMRAGRRSRESKSFRHGVVPRLTLPEKIARMRAKLAILPIEQGAE